MADPLSIVAPPGSVGVVVVQATIDPQRGVGTSMGTAGDLTAVDIVVALAAAQDCAERAARSLIEQVGQSEGGDAAARLASVWLDACERCRRGPDHSAAKMAQTRTPPEPPAGGRLSDLRP